MARPSRITVGELYVANGASTIWRVDRLLADGVHVVLVSVDEPTRRKTVSARALADRQHFLPADGTSRR